MNVKLTYKPEILVTLFLYPKINGQGVAVEPYLNVAWTLIYELLFYFFVAIASFFFTRRNAVLTFELILLIFLLQTNQPFFLNLGININVYLIGYFLAGVAAYYFQKLIQKMNLKLQKIIRFALPLASLVGLVVYCPFFSTKINRDDQFLLIAFGLVSSAVILSPFYNRPHFFDFFGNISFGCYLLHPAVFVLVDKFPHIHVLEQEVTVNITKVGITIVFATFAYNFYEKPIYQNVKALIAKT